MSENEYKRVTREEAFSRDPYDPTPIEYEDEVELMYYNLDTGEIKRFKSKGVARIGGKPSPAICAYYERERKLREGGDTDHRRRA